MNGRGILCASDLDQRDAGKGLDNSGVKLSAMLTERRGARRASLRPKQRLGESRNPA